MLYNAGIDLINSRHIRNSNRIDDNLEDIKWIKHFADRWNFPLDPEHTNIRQLKKLRTLLREIADSLTSNNSIPDALIGRLNKFLKPVKKLYQLSRNDDGEFALVSENIGSVNSISEIARLFSELITEGEYKRLKLCANEHCKWAFYDESRNRSRRWCDSKSCGNMMKVRAFRNRKSSLAY